MEAPHLASISINALIARLCVSDLGLERTSGYDDLSWRYLTSLHWSLTQFTPASMDVSARNEYERIMSILAGSSI